MTIKNLHLLLLLFWSNILFACPFFISENHTATTCPNAEDGTIELTVAGLDSLYFFHWETLFGSGLVPDSKDQVGLSAGWYSVTVSDAAGCEEILEIQLEAMPDLEPPLLQCPNNFLFNLSAGACDQVVYFQVNAADNCVEPELIQTSNSNFASGNAFPIGITILTFEASDGTNTSNCSFFVKVNEYQVPGGVVISCSNNLNVAVDGNCSAGFTAQSFLTGSHHGCYDDYLLQYTNQQGKIITPDEFPNYLGKTIYAQVTDPDSGNSCFTTITLSDNLKPIILCQDTLRVNCGTGLGEVHPVVMGAPEVLENCGDYTLNFFDQFETLSCNDPIFEGAYSARLQRTWTALDAHGNAATPCRQIILFERKTLADIEFPLNLTDETSGLPSLECGIYDDSPFITGTPMVDSLSVFPSGAFCNFDVTYSDFVIDNCGGGSNILRTWTVQDDCQNTVISHLQIIRILDKTPPLITCPTTWTASTNASNCKAFLFLPQPTITDDCSNYSFYITSSAGTLAGSLLGNVSLGNHYVTYHAIDDCGNQSTCQMALTIYDGLPPTVLCKPSKQISLTANGQAIIAANTFDNSSYDECGGTLQFDVRRLDDACNVGNTDWHSTLQLCCEDVGVPVQVEVRVTDYSGNSNICNSVVYASDLLPPTIFCPTDVEVDCGFDYSDLTVFGKVAESQAARKPIILNGLTVGMDGLASDNCGLIIETLDSTSDIDNCGVGELTRTFKVTDPTGKTATCLQHIYVVNDAPFYINLSNLNDPNNDASFPPALILNGCNIDTDPSITGEPFILSNGCDLVTYSFHDDIFNQPGNAYLIQRKWTVIDFCQYQGNGSVGIWHYIQSITIQNADVLPPQFNGLGEVWYFCSEDLNCGTGLVNFSLSANDNCTPSDDLIWNYSVDLFNDGTPDLNGDTHTILGSLPVGMHRTSWAVTDADGNTAIAVQFIIVKDCLSPVPQCSEVFSANIPSNGFLSINAPDLQVDHSYDNCTNYEDLQFLVNFHDSTTASNDYPPDNAVNYLTFGCPDTSYQLTLWVGDQSNNWGNCTFYLHISDPQNYCSEGNGILSIAGNIRTETDVFIEAVEVNVNNASSIATANGGNYAFYNLPLGGDYSIAPYKNINPLNGVSTFDLVLIRKHILGVEMLNSPYKIIAADVNKSNTVTTFDLVELRKLILYIADDFSNNNAWRFIDADFEFPNASDPFETYFPEIRSYNNLNSNELVNFIGIKIGDVNGSANPAELTISDERSRKESLFLTLENTPFESGEMVKLLFKNTTDIALDGFQLCLKFDPEILTFQSIESSTLEGWNATHFNTRFLREGYLLLSWNGNNSPKTDQILFELTFLAESPGQLAEVLHTTTDFLIPEAYGNNQIFSLGIEYLKTDLNPNIFVSLTPNPFQERAIFRFQLPAPSFVQLHIFDAVGHLVMIQKVFLSAGQQELEIWRNELKGTGVYFYQITIGVEQINGKMIVQ